MSGFSRLVDCRTVISIEDDELIDDVYRARNVHVDGKQVGRISVLDGMLPEISIGRGDYAIHAGTDIWFLHSSGSRLFHLELEDETRIAFRQKDSWCLVCELSVMLIDAHDYSIRSAHGIDDVCMGVWWAQEHLMVKDWNGHIYRFDCSNELVVKLVDIQIMK